MPNNRYAICRYTSSRFGDDESDMTTTQCRLYRQKPGGIGECLRWWFRESWSQPTWKWRWLVIQCRSHAARQFEVADTRPTRETNRFIAANARRFSDGAGQSAPCDVKRRKLVKTAPRNRWTVIDEATLTHSVYRAIPSTVFVLNVSLVRSKRTRNRVAASAGREPVHHRNFQKMFRCWQFSL